MLEECKDKWPKIDKSRKALREALEDWTTTEAWNAIASGAVKPESPRGSRRRARYVEQA